MSRACSCTYDTLIMFCYVCQGTGIAQCVQFSRKHLDMIELSCKIDKLRSVIFTRLFISLSTGDKRSGHLCCHCVSVRLSVTSRH